MDIHVIAGGVSAAAVAEAHKADVAIQAKHDVNYIKYWVNESKGKIFCLCSAPNAEAADRVHREAHGLAAERIIEVDPDMADDFLGDTIVAATGAAMLPSEGLDTGLRTLLFTDIVGSTAMTQRLGDKAAMEILDFHDEVVRRALVATGGREIKHLGDGIMAVFLTAEQAVECGAIIQSQMAAAKGDQPIQIRIGSASGEPVERHGDFFGSTVQLAARLCGHADPSQTLVSTEVTQLCDDKKFRFHDVGEISLKGFEQPVHAYAVMPFDEGERQ